MSEDTPGGGLYIDDDWKNEAAREKEQLAAQEQKERAKGQPGATSGAQGDPVSFIDLVNLLAIQVVVGLGGMAGPDGKQIPPNPMVAQHHLDMLDMLRGKTEGNLTEEEKKTLDAVLYELRMQYVQAATAQSGRPQPGTPSETA